MMRRAVSLLFGLLVCLQAHAQPKEATPKDVIVIGGALAEIVYALSAEHRLAGTDTTAIYPLAARETPKVGYQRSLSAEGILSLKPKIIIAASEAGPKAALDQIREAGVSIELFPAQHTASQVIENIGRIAKILEIPKQGAALQTKLRRELDQMRDTVSGLGGRKPKVLFLLAHGSTPQVSGNGTAAHAMIELAGGENAINSFTGYRPLTAEGAIAAAPDVILISEQGLEAQGGIEGLLKRPGLALTPAGQSKRIVKMDALQLMGFGPRLAQTAVLLATQLRASP